MGLPLNPKHLNRFKDLAHLLLKHGRIDLVRAAGLNGTVGGADLAQADVEGDPEQLAHDLEDLGPTFVKLGQVLSTRPDLLPPPYLDALARLQDHVEPFAFEQVEEIVAEELGVRISKAFETFDPEPIAAASLAQVHRATLRGGRAVAVKVQRPNIRSVILDDLEALDELATLVDEHTELGRRFAFRDMLAQFRKTLLRELDYRREAQNLRILSSNLSRYRRLVVPQPVDDYTTARVLTMDFVHGTKITKLSPLVYLEVDGEGLAGELSRAYLDQVLLDGFFHADPHPGNVLLTEDHRLSLLDLGMVAHVDPEMQEHLLKLLLAISEGHGAEVARLSRRVGKELSTFDEAHFTREVSDLVAHYRNATLQDTQVGRILMQVARLSARNGVRPAPELTMLGKTLLNLDEVARTLDPSFDPNAAVREHADSIMRRRMMKNLKPGNLFSSMLEINELVTKLPERLNAFLDAVARNEFEIQVQSMDEVRLLRNMHRIANRLALALVLSSLIIGAALMMRVDTPFTVFGYPGIALILFLIAAACGFALVISIFLGNGADEKHSDTPPS